MRKTSEIYIHEQDMLRQLREGKIDFFPCTPSCAEVNDRNAMYDVLISLRWEKKDLNFIVECKTRFDSVQIVQSAIEWVLRQTKNSNYYPMIYLPYLSPKTVEMLKESRVSGFDLCGNLFICIPGSVYIERIGKPNRFPSSTPIKNIYRKDSSLVPRLFLLQPSFKSISAIVQELKRRKGDLTQATVSKVCQRLEEDIIIGKRNTQRRKETYILQPETLLKNLIEQYIPPTVRQRKIAKIRMPQQDLSDRLIAWEHASGENIVRTGTASCTAYTVAAREAMTAYYCSHVEWLLSDLKDILVETERFADIELIETDEQCVYFDLRDKLYASPIQTCLELMKGDKREQQAAEKIAAELLKQIQFALKTKGD